MNNKEPGRKYFYFLLFSQIGAVTKNNKMGNLQKLKSIREGHRRVIQQQLDKIEEAKKKSTLTEFHVILEALTAKAESLLAINQKILEQTDVAEIEEEIIQGEEYSLNLEIILRELRAYNKSKGGAASRDRPTSIIEC